MRSIDTCEDLMYMVKIFKARFDEILPKIFESKKHREKFCIYQEYLLRIGYEVSEIQVPKFNYPDTQMTTDEDHAELCKITQELKDISYLFKYDGKNEKLRWLETEFQKYLASLYSEAQTKIEGIEKWLHNPPPITAV